MIEEALGEDAPGVLPEAIRLVELRARVPRYSADRAVLDLLLEQARNKTALRVHHDLDELAGAWSPPEAAEFESELRAQRSMDGRLWE